MTSKIIATDSQNGASWFLRHIGGVNCIPGHTSILGTLPLTETTVSANSSGSGQGSGTGTGVCGHRLADDEAIGNELADGLAGVGVGDFVNLVRVEPDLALSAADNGRRKALLRAEIDPNRHSSSASSSKVLFLCHREERVQRGVVATSSALI